MQLDALRGSIDELMACDPATFGDGESIMELERQAARLDAFMHQALAAFETSGEWANDGAFSAAAWTATRCHLPGAEARRQLRRGRALRHLPSAQEAWRDGAINAAHVDAIAALDNVRTHDALLRDEDLLVEQAEKLRFEHFTRALAYWEQLADPNGAEEDEQARRDRRDAYLVSSITGMWLGAMTLDPISGAIVSGELVRLEKIFFEADWAQAKERLGRDPKVGDLSRTPSQRRADALVEMATRSAAVPPGFRRPAPLFTVLVGYETLNGRILELAQGQALTPGSLVPWLSATDIERAVFEPGGRVEVSASARLFTGATRRALEVRDKECTNIYCDFKAERCQGDHVVPYAAGGLTTQANGRLLCGFHNRLRNRERPPPEE